MTTADCRLWQTVKVYCLWRSAGNWKNVVTEELKCFFSLAHLLWRPRPRFLSMVMFGYLSYVLLAMAQCGEDNGTMRGGEEWSGA